MRAKLAKLVEDAKVLEHAQKAKREVSVAKFKEEQAALTKKMKAAKIETDRRIEEARKQREAELKKGDQVRAELGAERIKEKKADLKKMREKAAARKAEFEAMMNAADGAGSVSTFFILYLFAHMNFVFYRRWRKRLTRFASSPPRKRKWRMPKTRRSERRSGWRSSR